MKASANEDERNTVNNETQGENERDSEARAEERSKLLRTRHLPYAPR